MSAVNTTESWPQSDVICWAWRRAIMIVSGSDGVMSINGIYIAFVLNLGEWPWSLHICV